MVDWFYIGYCTVMAMLAIAFAYAAVFGFRALRGLPRSFRLAFAAVAIVTTLAAQKTNNVPPNMSSPLPQMMQGGLSQTGFPGLTGFVGEGNLVNLVNHVQTTSDDIARGWRVEGVTTNENFSYEMPTNAALVGNWHVHGAASSFGNNRIDFGDWSFPLGTNGTAFSSFWYFIDGRIRPTPRDAAHEICAVGVPMSAVPGQSRFWRLDGGDGSRILTWENFFLGGDTNCPINAQIVLWPNGDFVTRSNEVETVCRRVNPDDWDGDGIANDIDLNPLVCDGDFFGPSNILPAGANTNAYCTVSVVATGPDALVTFAGDKPCNYPDPCFVAKSGETNEVLILIGKTYTISSDWPFAVVGVSDSDTEVWQMRGVVHQIYVRRPVTISASDGNPFTMSVVPLNLGGVFLWSSAQCHCSISGSGDTFMWNCPMDCTCCGCAVEGQYSYEGYRLPATSCLCGCHYDRTGPKWEPSSAPLAASVSASFSKSAVIFEDAYENLPGEWVARRSTRTRLNVVAYGGPNGGTLSVASSNLVKLTRISGPDLPAASVAVPADTQVSYAIVYEGAAASATAEDIVVTATIADCDTSDISTNECVMTSNRLELVAVYEAPENPCTNRHVYGVGEKVRFVHYPESLSVTFSATKGDLGDRFYYYDQFGGNIDESDKHRIYVCPIAASYTPDPTIFYADSSYTPDIMLVEPKTVITPEATWEGCHDLGESGQSTLVTTNYIGPMTVSFQGIRVAEIPCCETNVPTGYFASTNFTGFMTHSIDAGAGLSRHIQEGNRWTVDHAGGGLYRNWSAGQLIWNIPIGWGRLMSDGDTFGALPVPEYEAHTNSTTRPLLIGGRTDLYTQTFRIDEVGTTRIDKFGHWLSRSRNCRILLDGKTVQWTHPLW